MSRWLVNLALGGGVAAAFVIVDRYVDLDAVVHKKERFDAAPAFEVPLLEGGTLSLDGMAGKKVILNFWASWCVACKTERELLKSLNGAGDWEVIGMASTDKEADVRASEAEHPHGYRIALDLDGQVAQTFGIQALPVTLLIDEKGRVVHRYTGALKSPDVAEITKSFVRR